MISDIEEEWKAILQDFIDNLIACMSNKVRSVLRVRGGPKRY